MRRALVPAAFLAVAVLTGTHGRAAILSAAHDPGARHLLVALYDSLRTAVALAFAAFTFERAEPRRRCRKPMAYIAAAVAMATPVVSQPESHASYPLLLAGDAVAVSGCVWLLVSVLALGRCFGVLPEPRGLVIHGPYRFVRHPVYLGELVAIAGLLLAAPVVWNIPLLILLVGAQLARMQFEERALVDAFPEYADYAACTGRLLPKVRSRRRRTAAGSDAVVARGSRYWCLLRHSEYERA